MTASDRIALILGRAIMRSEALADDLEEARKRVEELEAEKEERGR